MMRATHTEQAYVSVRDVERLLYEAFKFGFENGVNSRSPYA